VVSPEGEVVGRGRNRMIQLLDPTAHAEILALREAAKTLQNYRLLGCKVYVTLEPCAMCAYAMVLARVEEVVFATPDPKTGACGSVLNLVNFPNFNHKVKIRYGLFQKEASQLLKDFFTQRRA
jgi:tRNA(adenine34) deaminase